MLKVQNIRGLTPFTDALNAIKLFSDERLEVIHITLDVNETIPNHENTVDVVFYILSGKGQITVDGEKQYIEKGDCVEIKKGLTRAWENSGMSPMCVMAIKKM